MAENNLEQIRQMDVGNDGSDNMVFGATFSFYLPLIQS
jgi:hypothetical protein